MDRIGLDSDGIVFKQRLQRELYIYIFFESHPDLTTEVGINENIRYKLDYNHMNFISEFLNFQFEHTKLNNYFNKLK